MEKIKLLKGVAASPGIAIGPAFFIHRNKIRIPQKKLENDQIANEIQRFKDTISKVENELLQIQADIPDALKEQADIFRFHLLMLKDRMIYQQTIQTITDDMINAEWAILKSLDRVRDLFGQIKEDLMREKIEDVEFVVHKVIEGLSGIVPFNLDEIESSVIVVAHDLSPADTVRMTSENILGFVTDIGSRTSHTAILARSLNLPSVVGLEKITASIEPGDAIIVDGINGEVLVSPDQDTIDLYRNKKATYLRSCLEIALHSHLPAETRDGYNIKIKANIELMEEIPSVITSGAEGVGLLRTEFLYLAHKNLPSEDILFETYKEVAKRISPYPVNIRTLDIGGDKFLSSVSLGPEINPALGLRAIRLSLKEPALFETQLRAILMASAYGKINILFPLISSHHEIIKAKEHLQKTMEDLSRHGIAYDKDLKVGVMIEVPAAVMIADALAKEVDFFSIGTNDLIQYSLAIDRINEHVAHLYEPLHPGILRLISMAVEAAHKAGIEITLCGEMAGEPFYVPVLLGLGLDELSMNWQMIPKIKQAVRKCRHKDCASLAKDILHANSIVEAKKRVSEFFHLIFPEEKALIH